MTSKQLLKLISENRELLQSSNYHAYEHLQILNSDYKDLWNEEVTINIELSNSIAEVQFNSNFQKAIENSLRIIDRYENSIGSNDLIRHYLVVGRCYANTGEFEKAEQYLFAALHKIHNRDAVFIALKVDILHVLTMNEQIAERGSDKSIKYLTEALELIGDSDDKRKAGCLMALGNVYINADMVDKALESYLAAVPTFEGNFDLAGMANIYCNIGTCYLKREDFPQAFDYFDKALQLRLKVGSPEALSISYYNLGLLYKGQRELDKAEELFFKCKDLILRTNNKPFLKDTEDEIAAVAGLRTKIAVISN
jgi:tetratricopeptide (TPR) repeat protein